MKPSTADKGPADMEVEEPTTGPSTSADHLPGLPDSPVSPARSTSWGPAAGEILELPEFPEVSEEEE